MACGPLKEKGVQKYRRLGLLARVTQYSGQTTYWRSENISEGGIFVNAAPTMPPGSKIEIGFFLPGSAVEIRCRAQVVWRNDANQEGFNPKKPFGMGLKFMALPQRFRARIRAYVGQADTVQPKRPSRR
jgi:uncharacterized protein (TIGR02266 family)